MAEILADDTKSQTIIRYGPELGREIAKIAQHKIDRFKAFSWARNLHFLVYDDEGDETDPQNETGLDSSDEDDRDDDNNDADDDEQLQKVILSSLQFHPNSGSSNDADPNSETRVQRHDERGSPKITLQTQRTSDAVVEDSDGEDEEDQLARAIAMSLEAEEPAEQSEEVVAMEDGELDQAGHDEDEDAELARAIALSLEQDDSVEQDQGSSSKPTDEPPNADKQEKSPREKSSCQTCKQYPRFPRQGQPLKFKIVQFSKEDLARRDLCHHYVAVSYCWRSDDSGRASATRGSYQVRDPRSVSGVRKSQAPDEILTRAVDFARAQGARLIWLDQECLPQDDSDEKELGIQAMDMVYQRAKWCVGLLDSVITSQHQLDALASVLDWALQNNHDERGLRRHTDTDLPFDSLQQHFMDFMELFSKDLWNTRAWILQEAFSSANHLMLSFRMTASLRFRPFSQVLECNPHPIPGVFNIEMMDTQRMITAAEEFLHMSTRLSYPRGVGISDSSVSAPVGQRSLELLRLLYQIHPRKSQTTNRHAFMYAVGGASFGPRKSCNAAVALTYLRPRSNHRTADRIAILANLTDYEIRLDTTQVAKSHKSLALCLFALAYINGDLSLFVPEVYQESKVQAPIDGPSWLLPAPEVVYSINEHNLRAGWNLNLRNARRYNFSSSGLILPAYIWNVDRYIDMTYIQEKWKHHWERWSCFQIHIARREGESETEYRERNTKIREIIANGQAPPRELFEGSKRIDWNSHSFGNVSGSDPWADTQVRRILSVGRLEGDQGAQWMIGSLFIDILRYLCNTGEAAAANSIWHSIRSDCVKKNRQSGLLWSHSNWDALPDKVEDLLATKELLLDPWLCLQLDANKQGTFNQMWIIERIMQTGMLWVGNYYPTMVNNPGDSYEKEASSKNQAEDKDAVDEQPDDEDLMEEQESAETSAESDEKPKSAHPYRSFRPTPEEFGIMLGIFDSKKNDYRDSMIEGVAMAPRSKINTSSNPMSIIAAQTWKLLAAVMFRNDLFYAHSYGRFDFEVPTDLPLGFFVHFMMTLLRPLSIQDRDAELVARTSVFDVDGPCMIATPYDDDMERFPRSVLRTAQLCWVVEPVDDGTAERKETSKQVKTNEGASNTAEDQGSQIHGGGDLHDQLMDYEMHNTSTSSDAVPIPTTPNTVSNSDSPSQASNTTPTTSSSPATPNSPPTSLKLGNDTTIEPDNKVSHEDKDLGETKGKSKITRESQKREARTIPKAYHADASFRVLDRVKGAWEIMEENWHEYEFV